MPSIEQQIRDATPRNNELLQILSETDYAKPAFDQQTLYIADLETQLRDLDKRITTLDKQRESELKDHKKYRDSVLKRFAYKATRQEAKFNVKAEKEEREYFDALREEHRAKELRNNTATTLSQAQSHKEHLEVVQQQHLQAQSALDDLYDSIFEGPTPSYPEEDANEQTATRALETYQGTLSHAESIQTTLQILSTATITLSETHNNLLTALSNSRMDMFGGGMLADMLERSALGKAEVCLSQTLSSHDQARRLSPSLSDILTPLPPVTIAQGNLMSDVVFDNVFSDAMFHDKIKASVAQVEEVTKVLRVQVHEVKRRHEEVRGEVERRKEELGVARVELQRARERIFKDVKGIS